MCCSVHHCALVVVFRADHVRYAGPQCVQLQAHTFLVMVFFALGAAAFLGAVACTYQHSQHSQYHELFVMPWGMTDKYSSGVKQLLIMYGLTGLY